MKQQRIAAKAIGMLGLIRVEQLRRKLRQGKSGAEAAHDEAEHFGSDSSRVVELEAEVETLRALVEKQTKILNAKRNVEREHANMRRSSVVALDSGAERRRELGAIKDAVPRAQ